MNGDTVGFWNLAYSLRRRHERFFDLLERLATIASDAAGALAMLSTGASARDVGQRVQAYEQAGDGLVHDIELALAKAFTTPIDREDIYTLALQVGDIIELTNRVAWACDLMGLPAPTATMTAMIGVLVESTAVVARAVAMLRRRDYAGIFAARADVARLEKEGDRVYRAAVRGIFHPDDTDTSTLLRDREVLDDLAAALDRCGVVVRTLSTLAVKHR